MNKLFDFGPGLLAAVLIVLGTTQYVENTRMEEAAGANEVQIEEVAIPGVETVEAKVPEIGAPATVTEAVLTDLYWYLVDDNGLVIGTYLFHETKPEMLARGICEDDTTEVCLYGSETELDDSDPIGSTNPDNTITKTAP